MQSFNCCFLVWSYKNPSRPSSKRFGIPPTSAATTGTPKSMASPTEFGEFSIAEGQINTCVFKNLAHILSELSLPTNLTFSSRPFFLISFNKYFPYPDIFILSLIVSLAVITSPATYNTVSLYTLTTSASISST